MDYQVEMHKAGRITIPAEIRKAQNLTEGDILTIRHQDDGIRIITPKQAVEYARSLVKPYLDKITTEQFLDWKREEAQREYQNIDAK